MNSIYRRKKNRVIAGVCGGIADTLHIDAVWIRIAFVALALLDGFGLLLYLLGWLLFAERTEDQELDPWDETNPQTARIGGILLIIAGVAILAHRLGMLSWLSFGSLLPLALILGGIVLVLRNFGGARS